MASSTWAPDDDTRRLSSLIEGDVGRLVFAPADEAAYTRLTERVLAMFHGNDPLERFVYRGTPR